MTNIYYERNVIMKSTETTESYIQLRTSSATLRQQSKDHLLIGDDH